MTSKKVEKRIVFAVKGMRSIPVINFKKAVSIIVLFSFILCSCGNKSPLDGNCERCFKWELDPSKNEAEEECLEKEIELLATIERNIVKSRETCYNDCMVATECGKECKKEISSKKFSSLEGCLQNKRALPSSDKDVKECYNALLVCQQKCRQDANKSLIKTVRRSRSAKSKCSGVGGGVLWDIKVDTTLVDGKRTLSTYTQCVEPKIAACSIIVPGDIFDPYETSPASRCCFGDLGEKSAGNECVNKDKHSCYFDPVEHGAAVVKKVFHGGELNYICDYAYDAVIQALAREVLDGRVSKEEAAKKAEEIVKEKLKSIEIIEKRSFETNVLLSDVPVLVVFRRLECQPCKELTPVINELASEYKGRARICTIDTENADTSLLEELKKNGVDIKYLPVLLMHKNGELKKIESSMSIDALGGIINKQV